MSIRAGLQAWKHFAALLIAAAIVLAAPYGIAVAVRSAIASIILWKAETAISRTAADASMPLPAIYGVASHDWTGRRRMSGSVAAYILKNKRMRRLLRGVLGDCLLVRRGFVLEGCRMWHRDDVVAGIDEVDVTGDAG
jgi:hypothetical protein